MPRFPDGGKRTVSGTLDDIFFAMRVYARFPWLDTFYVHHYPKTIFIFRQMHHNALLSGVQPVTIQKKLRCTQSLIAWAVVTSLSPVVFHQFWQIYWWLTSSFDIFPGGTIKVKFKNILLYQMDSQRKFAFNNNSQSEPETGKFLTHQSPLHWKDRPT